MRKRLLAWLTAGLLWPAAALAQITPTYTFTSGTVISSAQVNANFALLANALNRTGGTMTGTLTSVTIVPTSTGTYDIGSSSVKYRNAYFSSTVTTDALSATSATLTTLTCTGCVTATALASTISYTGTLTFPNNNGWRVLDSDSSHALVFTTSSNLTATRTLTFVPGDANRTLTLGNDVSLTNAGDAGLLTQRPVSADGTFALVSDFAGTSVLGVITTLASRTVSVSSAAMGTGAVPGPVLAVGRNSSGSTAPGTVLLRAKDNTANFLWVDTSSDLRTATAAPEEDGTPSDTSGTVVGTQTSMASTKNILGRNTSTRQALDRILRTPVYTFTYRNGAYNGTVFQGITTDDSPEFGMDPDPATLQMRSFNPVSAFGYTVLAIQELQREIDELRRRR